MLPKHVGLILDGNRRFAKRIMKKPWEGHEYGLKKARQVLKWGCEKGIKYFTAYTLSLENLKTRPKKELNKILELLEEEMDNILGNTKHVVHQFKVRVKFIGRLKELNNKNLIEKMKQVENKTKQYKNHFLNLAVAYGGRQEIMDGIKKLLEDFKSGLVSINSIDEKHFQAYLYTNGQPEPDLIIRTGGEKRLSNFLPFQSTYSELTFLDKKWPEIEKQDFMQVLDEFDKRERRFGR